MGTPHSSLLTPVLTMRLLLLSSILVVTTLSYKLDPSSDRLSVSRLLYDLDNYGAGSGNSMDWWAYGNNYCTNVPGAFINRASSVRFTGAPDDWNYDTINMYFNEYFIGDEEFTYNDTPLLNYDNRAQSIVVTGCRPWTIYEYDSYRGYAMCLYPESTSKCTPGFYSTRQSLGRLAGQVSSVRKGCYAKDKVLPDNH